MKEPGFTKVVFPNGLRLRVVHLGRCTCHAISGRVLMAFAVLPETEPDGPALDESNHVCPVQYLGEVEPAQGSCCSV